MLLNALNVNRLQTDFAVQRREEEEELLHTIKANVRSWDNSNGGLTWFGSSFTGPGNRLIDKDGHFNAVSLPHSPNDWVTMEHDVAYNNADDTNIDEISEVDYAAVGNALNVPDPWYGNYATAVGLVVKNAFERTVQGITGRSDALYPNSSKTVTPHIDWFDKTLSRKRGELRGGGDDIHEAPTRETSPELDVPGPTVDHDADTRPNTPTEPHYDPVNDNPSARDNQPGSSSSGGTGHDDNTHVQFVNPHIPDNPIRDSMSDGGASKRPADSSGGGGGKKPKSGGDLPGTGENANSDPDTGNPSAENCIIPRPISDYGSRTMVFRKNHSFLSYGLGWAQHKLTAENVGRVTTTSLMNLPVDKPWFYMSPSEYNILPPNSFVKLVRVKVVMRNPRTAFQTNASTTELATLNQNKFIAKGIGLNLKTRGINRWLTSTNMVVTSHSEVTRAKEENVVQAMYGSSTTKAYIDPSEGQYCLPHSYFNLPICNFIYFCLAKGYDDSITGLDPYNVTGWYRLNEYITKLDASFVTGKTVIDYNYAPQMGMLTLPYDYDHNEGYFGVLRNNSKKMNHRIEMTDFSGNLNGRKTMHNIKSGTVDLSAPKMSDIDKEEWKAILNPVTWKDSYYAPIEKNQYVKKGMFTNFTPALQPSAHIGIYPVTAITAGSNRLIPDKFTDVEVQWDINCEMIVESNTPGYLTHFQGPHVRPEDAYYVADHVTTHDTFDTSLSTYQGRYACRPQLDE